MNRSPLVLSGTATRKRSRYEPLRSLALVVSSIALLISLVAPSVTAATYQGWNERSLDRTPRPLAFHPDEAPAFLWWHTLEYTSDYQPFSVVYVRPLDSRAVPPPGLSRWPAAGEVVASPAFTGIGEDFDGRFGRVVGTIQDNGLLERNELLVYVGAGSRLSEQNAQTATGWRSEFGEPVGGMTYRRPMSPLLMLELSLFIAPAGWFFFASLRIGGSQRARRVEVLKLLGARPWHVRKVLWGESRSGLIFAWCVSVAVVVAASGGDLPLPGLDFELRGEDVRRSFFLVLISLTLGILATLVGALSIVGIRSERSEARRKTARASALRGALAPVAAALTVIGVNVTIATNALEAVPLTFGIGMLVTLALVPLSARSWLVLISRIGRDRAWRSGDGGSLAGAAQVLSAPTPPARFGATAAILIILVSFLFSFAQALSGAGEHARWVRSEVANAVATITTWPQSDGQASNDALEALSHEYAVVELREDLDLTTVIVGSAPDLELLGFSDSARPSSRWMPAVLPGGYTTEVGQISDLSGGGASRRLLVARRDGDEIDLAELKATLSGMTVPTWNAEVPGDSWMVGARVGVEDAQWVSVLGGAGIALALLALWVGYSSELLRAARSLLAVQVLAPGPRFLVSALSWRILAPVAVAVLGGSFLALILVWPLTTAGYQLPIGFVVFCAIVAVGTGGIALIVTVRVCQRATQRLSIGVPEE